MVRVKSRIGVWMILIRSGMLGDGVSIVKLVWSRLLVGLTSLVVELILT